MLELLDLRKRYGSVVALDGATLTAPRGAITGFVGPNGAGKTTAMRSIFGLVDLDAGSARWDGRPIDLDIRRRFGYMPEERGVYPRMRVGEQLTYFARLHGLDRAEAERDTAEWLQRLGIEDRAGSRVEELSHGNQQRVQLAVALVHQPDLIVLDEPFSGLDPIGVQVLSEVVAAEARRGAAVVFSSHQLELIEELCERVVVISRGRIALEGNLADLRERTAVRLLFVRPADGAKPEWAAQLPGVSRVDSAAGGLQLELSPTADLGAILAAFERQGTVREFRYEPPDLERIFLEAVRE